MERNVLTAYISNLKNKVGSVAMQFSDPCVNIFNTQVNAGNIPGQHNCVLRPVSTVF